MRAHTHAHTHTHVQCSLYYAHTTQFKGKAVTLSKRSETSEFHHTGPHTRQLWGTADEY